MKKVSSGYKKVVSGLFEYGQNAVHILFFFSEYKRLKGVFLLLFTFNSKNGLKNKLIIVFIKQLHPTKNRTNIFAIMWEPITLHMQEYEKLDFSF